MPTLYAMQSRILDELNRTDLSGRAADAIKTAIEYYSNEDWGWNQTATTFAVTSGTYSYDLPSDFRAEVFVGVDYSNRRYTACPISYNDWQSGFDTQIEGQPSRYVIWGEKLNLDPIPDRTYTVHLAYTHTLPELTDSGSNKFTTELEEVIRMRAEADLLMNVIRGPEAAQEAVTKKMQETEAYSRYRGRRTRLISSGIKRRGLL